MVKRRRSVGFAVALVLPVAACSNVESSPGSSTDAGSKADAGPSAAAGGVVGTFKVKVTPPTAGRQGLTAVSGSVGDGPVPSLVTWTQSAASGACTLWVPKVPVCSTPCGSAAACVANDICQRYPSLHSVGDVTVTGVKTTSGASSFTMTQVNGNYQPVEDLTYPGFSEGDEVRFEVAGGPGPGFTLTGHGIRPLELTSTSFTLDKNQPLALTWTAGRAGLASIQVKLDISHHGGTKGMITCETADSGSLEIASALVTQLINLGVAGFPTIVVSRTAVTSAETADGKVELRIYSDVETAVKVPGVDSCTEDSDCPSGKKCRSDATCS